MKKLKSILKSEKGILTTDTFIGIVILVFIFTFVINMAKKAKDQSNISVLSLEIRNLINTINVNGDGIEKIQGFEEGAKEFWLRYFNESRFKENNPQSILKGIYSIHKSEGDDNMDEGVYICLSTKEKKPALDRSVATKVYNALKDELVYNKDSILYFKIS